MAHFEFVNSPHTFVEMALQRATEYQDVYIAGHDAMDEAFNAYDRGELSSIQLREALDEILTPELRDAHKQIVWVVDTIACYGPDAARRQGVTYDAWFADRKARYGTSEGALVLR
jgi:hypothetical protein